MRGKKPCEYLSNLPLEHKRSSHKWQLHDDAISTYRNVKLSNSWSIRRILWGSFDPITIKEISVQRSNASYFGTVALFNAESTNLICILMIISNMENQYLSRILSGRSYRRNKEENSKTKWKYVMKILSWVPRIHRTVMTHGNSRIFDC